MRRLDEDQQCCGCAALVPDEDYNLGLHVAAIFILFAVSAAGALLPAIAKHVSFLSSRSIVIEWLMAFGYGVVIATGFIHMINEGAEMLSNPCLGEIVENYEALGLAIVLATVVLMHFIECESTVFFSKNEGGSHHRHAHGPTVTLATSGHSRDISVSDPVAATPADGESEDVAAYKPLAAPAHEKIHLQRQLAVMLFELGVIFHSVIIGIDLGVTAGMEFKTLLAAICFHQFFEGVAIGGSALGALESLTNVMILNFAYAATTPLGLVIGIAIRSTYSATSVASLWVQGVLNCMAGGILLYTGIVQLMTYQMTTNHAFLERTGAQRLVLYTAFWLGAGFMALIGKWA